MLRIIDIPHIILQLIRGNYALTSPYIDENNVFHPSVLNKFYAFILAVVWSISAPLTSWDYSRRKYFAIASCDYGSAQCLAILNKWHGTWGNITYSGVPTSVAFLYHKSETPIVYAYHTTDTVDALAQLYLWRSGATAAGGIITIPQGLSLSTDYNDFVADLNTLTLFGVPTMAIKVDTTSIALCDSTGAYLIATDGALFVQP